MLQRGSLRRALAVQVLLLLASAAVLAGGAVWGLRLAGRDYGLAAAGYRELSQAYEVGSLVRSARTLATSTRPDVAGSVRELDSAARRASTFGEDSATERWRARWPAVQRTIASARDARAALPLIDAAVAELAGLAREIQENITSRERQADANRRRTMLVVLGGALVLAIAAALTGLLQYRAVTRPLGKLEAGTRRLAQRRFDERLDETGPREFADLAASFNLMSGELETVYRDLEAKVAARSRELVESARLASVGFLAAGVAHEINNPLGIIAGYAERGLRRPEDVERVRVSLEIIVEEAFRCRKITDELLALARPGDTDKSKENRVVDLGETARRVIANVTALPRAKGRTIELVVSGEIRASATVGDVVQILMNLLVNALEADAQHVTVAVEPNGTWAQVTVADNGTGISSDWLTRIFEPFVTTKPSDTRAAGLGLAIVRTLVAANGGAVHAASPGPGKGASFTVRFPPATP